MDKQYSYFEETVNRKVKMFIYKCLYLGILIYLKAIASAENIVALSGSLAENTFLHVLITAAAATFLLSFETSVLISISVCFLSLNLLIS